MAKKNIEIKLNRSSIEEAIRELEEYQERLENNLETFIRKLVNNYGMPIIRANYGTGQIDEDTDTTYTDDLVFDTSAESGNAIAILKIKGRNLLFIEFGSGFEYNADENPLIGEKGLPYGPGTFPGQTHVPEPGFWFYKGSSDVAIKSKGIEATMPMYKSIVEMREQLLSVAKEVFGE